MSFNPLTLNNFFLALTAWGAAFLVALWASLVIWTFRDIKGRSRDLLVRILATLVVALLFLPGILVYLILRPPRSLEEEYQQTLEEEALLQAIEDSQLCPGCGRRIKENWLVCPNCQTKLKKACHSCGRLMELPWNICPYCGTPAPGMRREGLTMDEALRNMPQAEDLPGEELPEGEPSAVESPDA
jgi:RNA polymerase subunit RPABC4/transcription elongation factor Spt4